MKFNINKILLIIILILCSLQLFHALENKIELQKASTNNESKNTKTEMKISSNNSKTNVEMKTVSTNKSTEESKAPQYEIPVILRHDFVRIFNIMINLIFKLLFT